METYFSPDEVPAHFGPSAVTIGKFDGVHAGHRAVVALLQEIAEERALSSTVVTFDRHPLALLAPERCPPPLASNAQKLERLAETGLDAALVLVFDRERSVQSAEDFVLEVIVGALNARVVLVGRDFRFGVKGTGTVALLEELGSRHGFEVMVIDDVAPDGDRRVSSTWIRELLAEGRVAEAGTLLGSLPTVRGMVVRGQQRGRTLGYPTANLSPSLEGYIPADGVYAAWLSTGDHRWPAAVSVGNNPTFEGVPEKQVEAHALDQVVDLYDQTVEVAFVDYVRGMRRFSGPEALTDQMRLDEASVRGILGVPERQR